ncbi:imidazolonepropionase [Sphingomicrobium astaxanthinifaciens]|uniref:imidazolonepropionase n=1 Tax=Sphingomicrobium astaxanthinifaciens TaxID=1227949 RepID=UPI001FCAF93A|nr:imidazolonepropionase [Sphingomicrobium astaxanthinifaciens]MCJ7421053.1 imidazolonepropionase [Sphingomicrobium astaxanthinifaciens]
MQPRGDDPLGRIDDGAVRLSDGCIVAVGRRGEIDAAGAEIIDLGGGWLTPGLIDCHTHLVFGGTRAHEHAMRRAGASYEEIAAAGGGIVSTVRATRAASEEQLLAAARRRLDALAASGATTVEVKSGYGLDADTEVKMLRVARALDGHAGVSVVPTFLALHALPPGADRAAYVEQVARETTPRIAEAGLARSVDAFCERIAFTAEEVEQVFAAAARAGLPVRLHAEQLSNSNGAAMASRFKALSADHLEHLDADGARAMAAAGTVAVLLPAAFYCLRETHLPPVALLREAGVRIAIATDCNPGTSPTLSLPLVMNMAATLFGLSPGEALAGMTVHAAAALGLDDRGRIAPGQRADLCAWDINEIDELAYWIGLPGPSRRFVAGEQR